MAVCQKILNQFLFMHILDTFSFFVFSAYCILILSFLAGWIRPGIFTPYKINNFPFISVVIAFRNEEKNIVNLLNDLLLQDYPFDKFEIIMVNDHSDDGSCDTLEIFSSKNVCQIKVLTLEDGNTGKKKAVDTGIKAAQGELIMATDADCRLPKSWISSFVSFYLSNNKPKMVLGLVDLSEEKNFFNLLQNLEFISLIGCGAGAAGIGRPIYCNAANIMFERKVYFEITDPLNVSIASGDDTFLLHQVKKKYPLQLKVLKSKNAIVTAKSALNLKDFINQRIRWSSKGRYYSDSDIIITAIVVTLTNIVLMIRMLESVIFFNTAFFYLFLMKITTDWLMLAPVLNFFNKKKLNLYVPILSVIYPFYIVIIILASVFSDFTWKDRVYKKP